MLLDHDNIRYKYSTHGYEGRQQLKKTDDTITLVFAIIPWKDDLLVCLSLFFGVFYFLFYFLFYSFRGVPGAEGKDKRRHVG